MSSWFSRVAPGGKNWVGGNGTLTLGGQDDGPGQDIGPGYGPKWIDASSFLAAVGSDLVWFGLDGTRTLLDSRGYVYFDVAPDGRWIGERDATLYWSDGGVWPGYSTPAISNTRWACLQHDTGALIAGTGQGQNGRTIEMLGCLEPRLAGDYLVYRKDHRILGQLKHDEIPTDLSIPGEIHFWPVPVLVDGDAYVLTNTNSGRLLFYPFGSTKGYEVARGITDFADAQAIDDRYVRVVWSEKGEHRERTIDLAQPMVDLRVPDAKPNLPWKSDSIDTAYDIREAWRATATAERSHVCWFRKGDPVANDPQGAVGAWLDYDPTTWMVGLLADSSTGEKVPPAGVLNDWMYFAKARPWFPLIGMSGWEDTYYCEFWWRHHLLAGKTHGDPKRVRVVFESGYGVFNGVEVFYRHTYDASADDSDIEYSFYDKSMREIRWEMWHKGAMVQHTQPVPFTGPEPFATCPRPQPYGPIEGDEMNAPGVTIDSYDPVIRPGQPWKIALHDRNNDVHVTVELRDGSVYASLKNAKGEDRSGSKRPVAVQP